MARRIDGMVVVITGASSGIGEALARALGARGARLVLAARRADRLEALNASLGGRHLVVPADVARPEDCERLVARSVEHFGRIDTLVCNAGYGMARAVTETTPAEMQAIFQTNVFGTIDPIRAAVPIMRQQARVEGYRGQIMIVSSAAARRGLPYFGPYSATKAAQLSLAEALRVELRPDRIALTSVHPVGTETPFFATAEALGGMNVSPKSAVEVRQSPDAVARAMIRGIERPRPEVWPLRSSRWMLSLATLMPRLVDRIMAGHRGRMREYNRQLHAAEETTPE